MSGGVNAGDLRALEAAGFSRNGGGGGGGGGGDAAGADERRAAAEEARAAMLKSILSPAAHERLQRVALVRPENARAVEEHLIRLARGGKLAGPATEEAVKAMLDDVSKLVEGKGGAVKKVTIQRKRRGDEDDDDDDLAGL